jgi:hypothetical protein
MSMLTNVSEESYTVLKFCIAIGSVYALVKAHWSNLLDLYVHP